MAPFHASLRGKLFATMRSGVVPQHGHFLEYFFGVVNIVVSAAYIYGAWTFLYEDLTDQGAWIFVVGSYTVFAMQVFNIVEERHYAQHCRKMDPIVSRRQNVELMEHVNYAIAAFLFAGGSFFYMPGMPGDEHMKASLGSALFIIGSLGFVLASYFNALGMAASSDDSKLTPVYVTCHYLYVSGLVCSQCGSVVFFAGSVLYRPELSDSCGAASELTRNCINPTTLGTYFFISGSCLYFVEAIAGFISGALKHRFGEDQVKVRDAHSGIKELRRIEAMLLLGRLWQPLGARK